MSKKAQCIFGSVFLGIISLVASVHLVYYGIFHSFLSFQTLGLAGDVTDFWREALVGILVNIYKVLTAFIPFVVFLIFKRKILSFNYDKGLAKAVSAVVFSVFLISFNLIVFLNNTYKSSFLYMKNDVPVTYENYGFITASSIDVFQGIFGAPEEEFNEKENENTSSNKENSSNESKDVPKTDAEKYGLNVLDIDFDSLINNAPNSTIRDMHNYFKNQTPTSKNKYTGMFKNKNLIVLCLEGFSGKVINKELTPTLYKMSTEGFVFNNFYDSLWGGSTASGEYANMTGNFYSTANCLKKSASTNQYYALGNLFKRADYNTFAYHNHTYTYYGRDKSHPNFGYSTYKGIGNGLTLKSSHWPNSDLELAEATIDEFINSDKPFHTYYMTVSGHCNYTWVGNSMSSRHRKEIPETLFPESENVKAYIACQLEVEYMLTDLITKLEAAGKLDDTVFAMCCDHYPYALTDSELSVLYGLDANGIRSNYDLYRNAFLLWSSSMKSPVIIDKPCSSYDIVPTLANLFGLNYDSRLITGKDVLSDCENIAIICTLSSGGSWNFITEQGMYSTVTKKFTPSEKCTFKTQEEIDAYASSTFSKVQKMRKYSFAILDNNYYKYVFN